MVNIEQYPPQEPFSDLATDYHTRVMCWARGIDAHDVSYGDDAYQSIAIYPPAVPSGTVLMFIHGGGWTNGYKEWNAFMAPALLAEGVILISIGYRLAPGHLFPTGLEDCMDGVAWVWRHIDQYAGDSARLFVGGHSAGGHYAALKGVRRDWQESRQLPRETIRGCLPISGVYQFGEESGLSMRPRFLGNAENDRAASPLYNIDGVPPPFFMAYGEEDFPHLIQQSQSMEHALNAAGGDVDRIELTGCNHLSASYAAGDPDQLWVTKAVNWMKLH